MNVSRKFVAALTSKFSKNFIRPLSASIPVQNNITMNGIIKDGAKRIVWVDLEMTGLDIETDHIMEIACLVTDANLSVLATGPNIVIRLPDDVLNTMGPWCIKQHGESGLTDASRKSTISLKEAEDRVLQFVKKHVPENKCPLGGNSVYMDRLFLRKYMPSFDRYLHYRIIDVSTIKELAKRWYQSEFSRQPMKNFKHRTMDDILDSIEELKYYKENIFKNKDGDILQEK